MGVGADAGVFRKFAIWAIRQIEGELIDKGFGIGGGLDLHDDREVVACGDALIGKENVFLFCKGHLDRGRSLAGCDDDDLLRGRDGLALIVEKGDLNFTIRCDKKFGVRLDGSQNATAIGSGDFLFMAMVIARLKSKRAEEGDGEWEDACGGFHRLV